MAKHKAHAAPTKDFFVRMITRDISLEDCILDLIDNCLDGARKVKLAAAGGATARIDDYSGCYARVTFSADRFSIADNCGGISIAEAIDYAFHFGRRADAPPEGTYSIGLYGIGMKRAIFKIGNEIAIVSSTVAEAFRTNINVPAWLTKAAVPGPDGSPVDDWDFDMDDSDVLPEPGTQIEISQVYSAVSAQFANPTFHNGLARIVSRDYANFLSKGFAISVNGKDIDGFPFSIKASDDFKPIHLHYRDEGVDVDIIAGMSGPPPDELLPDEKRTETDYFGWFVLCNDRVVVAADKSSETVWGDDGFPAWHYQYYGFVGLAMFNSADPRLLPWKTTKRDLDISNPVYRRAVAKMKEASRSWISYTNLRRADLEAAKIKEAQAISTPLFEVPLHPTMELPRVATAAVAKVQYSSVQYSKPASEIAKVKKLLGNSSMPNYRMGEQTFEYYLKNESDGE